MSKRDNQPPNQPHALSFPQYRPRPLLSCLLIPFLTANSITHVLSIGATRRTLSTALRTPYPAQGLCLGVDYRRLEERNKEDLSALPCGHLAVAVGARRVSHASAPDVLKAALGRIGARPQELFGSVSLDVYELPKREKDRLALFESEDIPADGTRRRRRINIRERVVGVCSIASL
ncbi:hypothetical protein B0H14DRAFT_3870546 [Mycena olivaceomarginata]|nr:hypothetical protein B0H14DRAFT_3870546 [Mycena olivaceomarginata]